MVRSLIMRYSLRAGITASEQQVQYVNKCVIPYIVPAALPPMCCMQGTHSALSGLIDACEIVLAIDCQIMHVWVRYEAATLMLINQYRMSLFKNEYPTDGCLG